jgi:hypothetical protein
VGGVEAVSIDPAYEVAFGLGEADVHGGSSGDSGVVDETNRLPLAGDELACAVG